MGHGRLDSILRSNSISGINLSRHIPSKNTSSIIFAALLWIRIRIGSGSKRAKMTHKNINKFHFFNGQRCSLLRAEGFSCDLSVLEDGLWINKLHFLIKKCLLYFFQYFDIKILDPDSLELLDLDPAMNPDPQHCLTDAFTILCIARYIKLLKKCPCFLIETAFPDNFYWYIN